MTTTSGASPTDFELQPSEQRMPPAQRANALADPGFGQVFTDHMITIRWTEERGWHEARLQPYGPLVLEPATAALHYAQEIFEGLKAYRHADGSLVMFRPQANAARFNRTAVRMGMPELPEETFLRALDLLVSFDHAWVPEQPDHSLYLRPFMFATDAALGVNSPSKTFLFLVIASPSGAYFSGGVKPVSLWVAEDYTRAAPGGTGAAKCAGNYAASFAPQRQAVEAGCDQVVYLDAVERHWVEELGGMNLFFVYGRGEAARIVTPTLTGTLLPGVTRDSLLKLAPDLGIPASESRVSIEQWRDDAQSGELTEVFACGTAAVITPVGRVKDSAKEWTIGDGQPGSVTMRLRDELMGIQRGTKPDPYGWVRPVEEPS